ncbi:IPT/TIG domain-containing protein [Arthrobacter sp. I2-34]|uniref:IPT/TIG domain-containing protein n=1 Tax=Arthrobacter hankyongi TaxID=2904801 RepID=A0ABS9L6X5_9MICC|nr:IPT/TIG domain-containing protein [Arthrobacter hankyongi]MCG2622418.1 IPT/TIG domain-containing protein [Arthrobacter hankyongi]
MGFKQFPDPQVTPLTLGSGGGRLDSPFSQLAGAPLPEFTGIYARMMFIRVAMIGGSVPPTVFLRAGQGPAVAVSTATQPVFRSTGPGGAGTGFVGDVFLAPGSGNVLRILMGFDRDTVEAWTLGIRNNDPVSDRQFTWVVADNPADAAQPWADPASYAPGFAAVPFTPDSGAPGTSVVLHGTNFHVGTPTVTFGNKPAALLAPPAPTALTVAVPEDLVTPGQPGADVQVSVSTSAGTAVSGTGFHALPPPPVFAAEPFTPAVAKPGQILTLHGKNFHYGPVQAGYGFVSMGPGPGGSSGGSGGIIDPASPTEFTLQMPGEDISNPEQIFPLVVRVSISTAGGTAQCPGPVIVVFRG